MRRTKTRLVIREIAEKQGWNAPSLGRAADINPHTITGIWRDPYRRVSFEVLRKIASALNVAIDELYVEEEEA